MKETAAETDAEHLFTRMITLPSIKEIKNIYDDNHAVITRTTSSLANDRLSTSLQPQ